MANEKKEAKDTVHTDLSPDEVDRTRLLEEKKALHAVSNQREHFEGLGAAWTAATGMHPRTVIPQAVATVLHDGGTRNAWQWQEKNTDFIFMAWPKDQPIRAGVLLKGEHESSLKPVSALPLIEGVPNDLTIATVHPWEHGHGCNVGVSMDDSQNPMWFYDPFYERDKEDLTQGVTQSFLLGALAYGVRKALLDELTITQGPQYDEYALAWLSAHPDKTRIDVPPLKISVAGRRIIYPGHAYGEYQIRTVVEEVEEYHLDKMPIKILYTSFPFENRPPLRLPIYVADVNLGKYEPNPGQEIDAYVWLQGRIVDSEPTEGE